MRDLDRAAWRIYARRHPIADPAAPGYLLSPLEGAGFRVEAMILAVPAAMSNQGIVARYAEQIADRGHGRLTGPGER